MSTTTTVELQSFTDKDPAESLVLGADFAALTAAPVNPVVTCTRVGGTPDANAAALPSGPATVAGTQVLRRVAGGVHGADYLLRFECDTAAGDHFVIAGLLRVRRAGG